MEASWSGSPTSTSRVSGRTASSRRAIIVSDTIDVSSTTITSCGSRLSRSCRKRTAESNRDPSSRCSVVARRSPSRAVSAADSRCAISPWTASSSRAAALPVGAVSAIRSRRSPASDRLLGQQGEQAGHRRGLAGARPAGEHGRPLAHGGRGGRALLVVRRAREEPVEAGTQRGLVGDRRWQPARRGGAGPARPGPPRASSGRGRAGSAPAAAPAERRAAGSRPALPASRRAPATASPSPSSPTSARTLGQVEAHRAGADRPDRQRAGQRDPFVALPDQAGEAGRHVHGGGVEHAGPVELPQQPGRAERLAAVELVLDRGHAALPSSRSDSASTSAGGTGQLNTPAGWPSTTGVSGPHMPRR